MPLFRRASHDHGHHHKKDGKESKEHHHHHHHAQQQQQQPTTQTTGSGTETPSSPVLIGVPLPHNLNNKNQDIFSTNTSTSITKPQPVIALKRDDSDYSLYAAVSNTSVSDMPHGSSINTRSRSSSMSQKLKSFFSPHSSSVSLNNLDNSSNNVPVNNTLENLRHGGNGTAPSHNYDNKYLTLDTHSISTITNGSGGGNNSNASTPTSASPPMPTTPSNKIQQTPQRSTSIRSTSDKLTKKLRERSSSNNMNNTGIAGIPLSTTNSNTNNSNNNNSTKNSVPMLTNQSASGNSITNTTNNNNNSSNSNNFNNPNNNTNNTTNSLPSSPISMVPNSPLISSTISNSSPAASNSNSPHLQPSSLEDQQQISELNIHKLNIMPSLIENDIDEVLDGDSSSSKLSTGNKMPLPTPVQNTTTTPSTTTSQRISNPRSSSTKSNSSVNNNSNSVTSIPLANNKSRRNSSGSSTLSPPLAPTQNIPTIVQTRPQQQPQQQQQQSDYSSRSLSNGSLTSSSMAQQTSTSSAQTQDNSHDASTVSRGRSLRVIQKLFTSDKSDEDVSSASTTSVHTPTGSTPFPNGSNNEISSSMSNHSRSTTTTANTSGTLNASASNLLNALNNNHHPPTRGNRSRSRATSPDSRSRSTSRSRRASVSIANIDQYTTHTSNSSSLYNGLKHTTSVSAATPSNNWTSKVNSNRGVIVLHGRLLIFPDGKTHEHDYIKYKTTPAKNKQGSIWGWMGKKDSELAKDDDLEKSISLLPDNYSLQLMELKSKPENYRWNYDDDADDDDEDDDDRSSTSSANSSVSYLSNGEKKPKQKRNADADSSTSSLSEDEDDGEFDDEADDALIEPIIDKDQLNLINLMMDKIEHPEKYKEKLAKSSKQFLKQKYGHIEGVVGRGSYGTVRIAIRNSSTKKMPQQVFAIKILKQRPNESLHHFGNRVTSEFMISSSLTHQAIINVFDLMVDPINMVYSQIMEYVPCGDLFALIYSTSGLEVIECDCFFKQILNAVTYLHSVGISHNDLKVENLLLTKTGQLKIIDFGTSAVFQTAWEDKVQLSSGTCGSERYVSPEQYIPHEKYDPRLADIWSLGIIYLVMMYGNYVWESATKTDENYEMYLDTRAKFDYTKKSKTVAKQYKLVKKGAYNRIESITTGPYPNSRKYVLYNILNPDPKTRMRSYQIWQSDWIQNLSVCEAGRGYLTNDGYYDIVRKYIDEQKNAK